MFYVIRIQYIAFLIFVNFDFHMCKYNCYRIHYKCMNDHTSNWFWIEIEWLKFEFYSNINKIGTLTNLGN